MQDPALTQSKHLECVLGVPSGRDSARICQARAHQGQRSRAKLVGQWLRRDFRKDLSLKFRLLPPCLLQGKLVTQSLWAGGCRGVGLMRVRLFTHPLGWL